MQVLWYKALIVKFNTSSDIAMVINIYFSLTFSLFIINVSFAKDHCTSSYCSVLDYQDDVDWTEHISDLWAWMSAQKSKNVVTFCSNDKSTFSPTDFTHSPIKGKTILFSKYTQC